MSPETLADLTGKGVPDDELILSDLVFREIFEPEYQELEGKKGKRTVKSYPKFAVISKKLADAVAARLSDYDGRIKDLPEDEAPETKTTALGFFSKHSSIKSTLQVAHLSK